MSGTTPPFASQPPGHSICIQSFTRPELVYLPGAGGMTAHSAPQLLVPEIVASPHSFHVDTCEPHHPVCGAWPKIFSKSALLAKRLIVPTSGRADWGRGDPEQVIRSLPPSEGAVTFWDWCQHDHRSRHATITGPFDGNEGIASGSWSRSRSSRVTGRRQQSLSNIANGDRSSDLTSRPFFHPAPPPPALDRRSDYLARSLACRSVVHFCHISIRGLTVQSQGLPVRGCTHRHIESLPPPSDRHIPAVFGYRPA